VTRTFPSKFLASSFNCSRLSTILTPPALPLPPAWIWALRTTLSVFIF